jgi:hypothetical protein
MRYKVFFVDEDGYTPQTGWIETEEEAFKAAEVLRDRFEETMEAYCLEVKQEDGRVVWHHAKIIEMEQ